MTKLHRKHGERFQGEQGQYNAPSIRNPLQQRREVVNQRWLFAKADSQPGLQGLFHGLLNLESPAGFIEAAVEQLDQGLSDLAAGRFWSSYEDLPVAVQKLADRADEQLRKKG